MPQQHELLQAAENARQAGHDQSVHGRRYPSPFWDGCRGGAKGGELAGQTGRLGFHVFAL